jgi:hypothetical protein
MTDAEREYYMRRRQCLIMELGALEDLLGLERSIVPKRKRVKPETVMFFNTDNDVDQDVVSRIIEST